MSSPAAPASASALAALHSLDKMRCRFLSKEKLPLLSKLKTFTCSHLCREVSMAFAPNHGVHGACPNGWKAMAR